MDAIKTSLSAGAVIYALLREDTELMNRITKVYPIYADKATLPYIAYRRVSMGTRPTKDGYPSSDFATIEVSCFCRTYIESIEIAERVRSILDGVSACQENIQVRSCYMVDSDEAWMDDAYIQTLIFQVKV